jgi:hypothetical protein
MSTESYIIRVYRREEEDAKNLVGLVEIVETQEKKPFNNFDELRDILRSRDWKASHHLPKVDDKGQRSKIE